MRTILLTTLLLSSALSVSGQLVISEFLAINGNGLEDKNGDRSDWIEIHNTGTDTVELTGWYLTDDADNLTKWMIPKGNVSVDGYILIYASGKNDSGLFSSEIHTNFSLSGDGEYLALVEPDGTTIAHDFAPAYPEQRKNISYGLLDDDTTTGYFQTRSPGKANKASSEGLVQNVTFSVKRGYFDEPFMLELTTETPDAMIRYTDNGLEPSLFTARTYTEPILIDSTKTIRARAEKAGFVSSRLKTHTFLFVDDIIQQEDMSTNVTEDDVYGPLMRDALLAHPAVNIVTPDTDISKTVEDPASVEMIFQDGSDGFQIDCGVKRVGGHSLNAYPKNNMRLYFRSEYGKEKLRFPLFEDHPYTDVSADSFDQLNLRSGSHDSLFYLGASSPPQQPSNGQYLRNRWINDMQFLMGHESLRGRWVHAYINGNYWGHYHLHERNTQDYFASYLGGNKSDYVAINKGQGIGSSDMDAWRAMINSVDDYEDFQRRVDILNYIDYMLLNYYCGNDWDWNTTQNWGGGGPVDPDAGGMKFIAWDSDIIFRRLNDNNLGRRGPHDLFPNAMRHEEFAMLVADRIQNHFYNDGLLTPEIVAKTYNFRAEQIRLSIIGETARWQAGRWTRDNQWQRELDRLNDDFFPNRTEEVLRQFQSKKWTGITAAPTMNQYGGYVENGFTVRLLKSLFARGTIVYTTDGTDPRLPGGEMAPSAQAFTQGFPLTETTVVKARVMNSDGWSALVEARFVVDQVPASFENLTISKVHYRPAVASEEELAAGYQSRKDFEFVELLNLGEATIDLANVRFNKGIQFQFATAERISIAAGERLFIVRNPGAFAMRYGAGLPVEGSFSGSLSNDGELLRLVNNQDDVLQELEYNDVEPWPIEADGDGPFLVLKEAAKASISDPEQWRASANDELPGGEEVTPPNPGLTYETWIASAIPEGADAAPESDYDNDQFANVAEFLLGSDPARRGSTPAFTIMRNESGIQLGTIQRKNITGYALTLEHSVDLTTWMPSQEVELARAPLAGQEDLESVVYQSSSMDASSGYFRLRVNP